MKKKNIIILSSILVGGTILFFVGKNIIAKRKEKQKIKNDEAYKQKIEKEKIEAKKYSPTEDIKILEGYIKGANFVYYPDEVSELLSSLTDEKLKVLATAWKKKNKESLYKSLDDEWDSCGFFENCYKAPLSRLRKLGL